jgi:SAM-dependent MidA family methyltransferase
VPTDSRADASLVDLIHERGPLTVAAFMDLALYDPRLGYYATAAQRSGRAGDFFTSVDVGPLFGELLAVQIAEMADLLQADAAAPFDLVEVAAGNGRLAADVLRALRTAAPAVYSRTRLHLIDISATARAAHASVLADVADRLTTSSDTLPEAFEGVLVANELLDAMPVHQVVMRPDGLREVYVVARGHTLATAEGPLSTPRLSSYFARLGVMLEQGWRAEVNLRALDWMDDVGRRLRRGFAIVIDYGHVARELYSAGHAGGTLTAGLAHTAAGPEAGLDRPAWLGRPGERDLTAHVDFTSVRQAARKAGLTPLALLDQTYFLLGLANPASLATAGSGTGGLKRRLALKTLLLPGGLGSTCKVLILGRNVGTPFLKGCSYRIRVT